MRSKTVARTLFSDPANPTREEVVRWAYVKQAPAPDQDFELFVIYNSDLHATVLACAADQTCPKQRFFLSCLYVLVGDAVRSRWDYFSKTAIERLIQQGLESSEDEVRQWAARARDLVAHPGNYNYEAWGLGSHFAYAPVSAKSMKRKRKRSKS